MVRQALALIALVALLLLPLFVSTCERDPKSSQAPKPSSDILLAGQ